MDCKNERMNHPTRARQPIYLPTNHITLDMNSRILRDIKIKESTGHNLDAERMDYLINQLIHFFFLPHL